MKSGLINLGFVLLWLLLASNQVVLSLNWWIALVGFILAIVIIIYDVYEWIKKTPFIPFLKVKEFQVRMMYYDPDQRGYCLSPSWHQWEQHKGKKYLQYNT